MKNNGKLSKKDLKEGLRTYEGRIQNFEIYHKIIFLNYFILFLMYFLVNGVQFELIFWNFLPISFMVFLLKVITVKLLQLESFEYLPEKERNTLVENFTSYFFLKRKRRDNKEIEHILNRIEQAELHFKKYDKFYKVNNFLSIFSIYLEILFFVILLNVIISGDIPNRVSFNPILIFIFHLNVYLTIVLIIRNTHINNLERTKNLFKISISKVIDEITEKIEGFALFTPQEDFIKSINENLISVTLQEWFNKYLGNFQDDFENNQLLYEYRDFIIDRKKEEHFLSLLINIKAKLQVFSALLKKDIENAEGQIEKISYLEKILDYIINNLKFNINNKKSIIMEKRGKITLLESLAIVFSNIFSILAFFFSI